VKTTATTGAGVAELVVEINKFLASAEQSSSRIDRRQQNTRLYLLELLRQTLFEKVAEEQIDQKRMSDYVEAILERRRDPYSIVDEMLDASGVGARRA